MTLHYGKNCNMYPFRVISRFQNGATIATFLAINNVISYFFASGSQMVQLFVRLKFRSTCSLWIGTRIGLHSLNASLPCTIHVVIVSNNRLF